MTDSVIIRFPRSIAERLEREARKLGVSLEEYVFDLVLRDLDPQERAKEYIEVSAELLRKAREELEGGDVRQAAEKLWGAAALAVKAYAEWRDRKRLTSHRELWEYSKKLIEDQGAWVHDAWMSAAGMHVCFYEGWCTRRHVEGALKRIEELVREVRRKITTRTQGN